MKKPVFDTAKPWAKLIFTAFLMSVSFLIFFLLGQLLSSIIYGVSNEAFDNNFLIQPENIGRLKILQAFQSVGLFVVPALLAAFLFSGSEKSYLYLNKKTPSLSLLIIFLLTISVQPLVNLLAEINQTLSFPEALQGLENKLKAAEEQAEKLTKLFLLSDKTLSAFFVNILIVAIIPAVGEELLFRGVLQRIFKNWTDSAHAAVWITALLFSAVHFQFYGFLPRLLLGALFGYLLIFSGNMWLPVAAHFLNNAMGVTYYHFFYEEENIETFEKIGTESGSGMWLPVSFFLTGLFIFLIYKIHRSKAPQKK
jgi:membrane protease YdiL (CAAX protease family)